MKDYLTKRDPNLDVLIARYKEPEPVEGPVKEFENPTVTQKNEVKATPVKLGDVIYRVWMLFLGIFIVAAMFNAATNDSGRSKLNCKDSRNKAECELRAFESRYRL